LRGIREFMKELINNKSRLKYIYKSYAHSFIFDSIVEGNTPAQIFVDDAEDISIFLICEGNCVYFGGEVEDKDKYKEAINFFKENCLSESRRKELGVVKINYYTEAWKKELLEGLKEFDCNLYDRSLFKQDLKYVKAVRNDDNVIVKKIDNEVLQNTSLGNLNCLIDEVMGMWGSEDNFIKNGFGYCAIMDGNIISWCTAEYVSKNYCGIGIETIEAHERKGVATMISNEFLKGCLASNITPYWDSWKKNIPSVRVAEKNNFKKVCDYKVVFIKFD
jgi:hypothetical protein